MMDVGWRGPRVWIMDDLLVEDELEAVDRVLFFDGDEGDPGELFALLCRAL